MALNLLKSGKRLTVSSADTKSYAEFESHGVRTTTQPHELASADVVFLSLPNGEAVSDVLVGEAGIANLMKPGQTIVDTSTIGYGVTLELAHKLRERGIHFIDAPVSGMEARAIDGTLAVMCGGDATALDSVKPFLETFASTIEHMGEVGSGQLAKLVNQLLFDMNCAALAEILPMAAKLGLDPEKTGRIVNSGTGRSYASEFFIPRILQDHFSDGYPMRHAYKDLVSAAELGARAGIPMPVLAAATATFQMALLKGFGDDDKGGMIKVFEDLNGASFRRDATETQ
ncbi:2-hydroxy-3-oxopropionate reductase [Caballeronia terrestris]|uniref:2-hydroxy-3-oxopropionate reductase n=2 Tax=Caballeronia terrestris TaxID=1226301 RepID=A0A158J4U9_9BURK|nr:2-hydroxy-3-oxopropionate reductase [Caballeronia terrestris]